MISFFLQLFVVLAAIVYIWFLIENEINRYRKGHIIYYASNGKLVVPLIARLLPEFLEAGDSYSLVELGAGLAPVARGLASARNWSEIVAVEWARSLAVLARLCGRGRIKVVRGSVFDYAIPKPSVVYCYLAPEIMKSLYESGAFSGCLVFSLTFAIEGVEAERTLTLAHWQSPLRIYDLRYR